MPLSLLSEQLRSRLRSGVAVCSMCQCVCELVENGLDAGAKCIAVRVDVGKYKIQVIDNGVGVARQDLDLIGQRYATSKCHTVSDLDHNLQHLGYRGEALASTVDCSGTVEITSRHHLSRDTYTKLFFHGKRMSVSLSSSQRPSVGTTITVHDFFYNLPVRRKAISANIELERIRQALQAIALVNPGVSFSLRDDHSGECVLQTRKTNSTLRSFSTLFGSARASGLKEVASKDGSFDISGYVSVESHHSKALQFIYVNKRLVKRTQLHSCVNNLLANSLVARKLSKQGDSKWRNPDNDILSPKRAADKHAVYVLLISCPRQEYDICLEPAKTLIEFKNWDLVLECLKQAVRRFLVEHNLTLGVECKEVDTEETVCAGESSGAKKSGEEGEGLLPSLLSGSCWFSLDVGAEGNVFNSELEGGDNISSVTGSLPPVNGEEPAETSSMERHSVLPSCSGSCGDDITMTSLLGHKRTASRLQLDGPRRSPLNSQSRVSKLAGLLRKEREKSSRTTSPLVQRRSLGNCDRNGHISSSFSQLISRPLLLAPCSTLSRPPQSPCNTFSRPTQPPPPCTTFSIPLQPPPPCTTFSRPTQPPPPCTTFLRPPQPLDPHSALPSQPLASCGTYPTPPQSLGPCSGFSRPPQPLASSSALADTLFNHHMRDLSMPHTLVSCSLTSGSANNFTLSSIPHNTMPAMALTDSQNVTPGALHGRSTATGSDCVQSQLFTRDVLTASCSENTGHLGSSVILLDGLPHFATDRIERPREAEVNITDISCLEPQAGHIDRTTELHLAGFPEREHLIERSHIMAAQVEEPELVREEVTCLEPQEGESEFITDGREDLGPQGIERGLAQRDTAYLELRETNKEEFERFPTRRKELHQEAQAEDRGQEGFFTQREGFHLELQEKGRGLAQREGPYLEPQGGLTHRDGLHLEQASARALKPPDKQGANKVQRPAPIWKEARDPCMGKAIYIHSKTGNTCSRLPTTEQASDFTPLITCGCDSGDAESSVLCSNAPSGVYVTGGDTMLSSSYGTRPISAAPHLSYDYESYFPSSRKRLRLDESARVATSTGWSVGRSEGGGGWEEGRGGGGGEGGESEGTIMADSEEGGEGDDGGVSFASLFRNWTNPVFLPGQMGIPSIGGCSLRGSIRAHSVINEYKFTREMLANVRVLGQVDKKFIACMLDSKNSGQHDLLVLFDQHAAHERVRLESLQTDLYEDDAGGQPSITSSKVHPPLIINLTSSEKKLARTYKKQFEALGVNLVEDEDGCVGVASLPSVFMEREVNEVRRGRPTVALELVQDMVVKHLEVLQTTCGGNSLLPSSLRNVLNSQACHSAIKFGDPLTKDKCQELIESLSKCKLPFQCAHGRPSLVPILDLNIYKNRNPTPETCPANLCKKLSAKLSTSSLN